MTTAERWVRWRTKNGMNQLAASKATGIPQSSLSLIEHGERSPTLDQSVVMASVSDDEVTPEMWSKDRAVRRASAEVARKSRKRKAA